MAVSAPPLTAPLTAGGVDAAPLFESPGLPRLEGGCHWQAVTGLGRGGEPRRLRVGVFPSQSTPAKARVLFCPGKAEFIEKYTETILALQARDLEVWIFDWAGQGLSTRLTGHPLKAVMPGIATMIEDLATLARPLTAATPKLPLVVIGHSMGGALAMAGTASRAVVPDALILSAPMTQLQTGGVPVKAARLLAQTMTLLGQGHRYLPGGDAYDPLTDAFAGNKVTLDATRFERTKALLRAHPQLAQGAATFGWLNEAFKLMARVGAPASLRAIACPTLLLSASRDQLIVPESHLETAAEMPAVTLVEFAGAEHELFAERDAIRDKVWHHIDLFLDRALA